MTGSRTLIGRAGPRRHTYVPLLCSLFLAATLSGCHRSPTTTGLGADRFDGTYDWFVQYQLGGATATITCTSCVFIAHGNINDTNGRFDGGVSNAKSGKIDFSGPCPVGGTATYTGILDDGDPKSGQGKFACTERGVTGQWNVLNGH